MKPSTAHNRPFRGTVRPFETYKQLTVPQCKRHVLHAHIGRVQTFAATLYGLKIVTGVTRISPTSSDQSDPPANLLTGCYARGQTESNKDIGIHQKQAAT